MVDIVYEDEYVLAVHKPAGLATQTSRVYEKDLVSTVNNYLSKKHNGKNMPQVGLINRLDQPVEGIVLFGLNKKATARLTENLINNQIEKYYYAGAVANSDKLSEYEKGYVRIEDYLIKDSKTNSSRVSAPDEKGAKKSVLELRCIQKYSENKEIALMEIHLLTGRHHQIRVQLAHADMPLLGDYKYAAQEAGDISNQLGIRQIALCAYKEKFIHPYSGEKIELTIIPEGKWYQLFCR